MILVITHGSDLGADLVIRDLLARGAEYLRLNTDELGTPDCHVELADNEPALVCRRGRLPASAVKAVWYRRFARSTALKTVAADYHNFVAREMASMLDAFLESISGLHVNGFDVDRVVSNRILQSAQAREAGFLVPDSLVTQDAARAKAFFARHSAVVSKAISFGLLDERAGSVAYTSEVRGNSAWEQVEICPTLFQERIPKRREWRVTTVGAATFSAGTRHDIPVDHVDWRQSEHPEHIFEAATLPADIEIRLAALCENTGVHFATHDLVETPAGDFFFLETNPAGQWGWLEMTLELPISAALADLLVHGDAAKDQGHA